MARQGNFNTALTATYRLQFHKDFDFAQGAKLAAYLHDLGISHVYASPIMKSEPGSMHGYDVTDFAVINPELGGEDGFRKMAAALQSQGVGLIIDIVPNHMAVGGKNNPYWLDLLEKGADSAYADFFDVDFEAPGMNGKILLPLLGDAYATAIAKGELVLRLRDDREGAYAVYHYDHCFPIRDVDQQTIRSEGAAAFSAPDRLHELLEAQHYRLASWRTANDLINYRRFFEITTLAGVKIERPEAFDKIHAVPLQLWAEGLIDGVRVDHIDGLTDPAGYCRQLHEALSRRNAERPAERRRDAYIVVENILASDERLPAWPIDGTTGYDFMNEVSALQHRQSGAAPLIAYWHSVSLRPGDFDEEERVARSELLGRNFPGQLDSVIDLFHRCAVRHTGDRDITRGAIRRAIVSVIGHLRVYRSYALGGPGNPGAGVYLERAFAAAMAEPSRDDQALEVVRELMNTGLEGHTLAEAIRRFNQLTAPVAAKAVEDTAFYRYGVLLSRNDVGFDAARMGMAFHEFHGRMAFRAREWPHGMLTTATHDHKRGEDVRARLAGLSEIPHIWIEAAQGWSERNAPLREAGFDRADEYMLFQTIVGAWPVGLAAADAKGLAAFADRLVEWQRKALREAKLRSSWLTPNADYEAIAETYTRAALDAGRSAPFLKAVVSFGAEIAATGIANSLTQTALRCLAPGVPDLYRGCEMWDLTLVDPDNRHPVDFELRRSALGEQPFTQQARETGALKQSLIRSLLDLRCKHPALFAFGDYRAIEVETPEGVELFAFSRRFEGESIVVALALRTGAKLYGGERLTPAAEAWGDARLAFDLAGYQPVWSGSAVGANPSLALLFADLPVAVWVKGG